MLPQSHESHRDTLNRISDLIETLIRQNIPELNLYPDERVKVISFTIATKTYKAITGREYSLNDPVQAVMTVPEERIEEVIRGLGYILGRRDFDVVVDKED